MITQDYQDSGYCERSASLQLAFNAANAALRRAELATPIDSRGDYRGLIRFVHDDRYGQIGYAWVWMKR